MFIRNNVHSLFNPAGAHWSSRLIKMVGRKIIFGVHCVKGLFMQKEKI